LLQNPHITQNDQLGGHKTAYLHYRQGGLS